MRNVSEREYNWPMKKEKRDRMSPALPFIHI